MSIRQNASYNLIGSFLPLLVSLITIPIYIRVIGEERYGILAIVWLLLGYFGLFDLGLGRATAQHVAAHRDASDQERAQIFWTAFSLNLCLGILGGVLVWPICLYFFEAVFKVEEAVIPEIQNAVPWLAIAVPIAVFSGTLTGALQGRERFLELNLVSVSGTLLFQILPLIVARYISVDLAVVLPAALFARFLTVLALLGRCKRHILSGYAFSFSRVRARQLLRFGGWITVTSFVGPMMVILDRIIIGSLMGARAVTYYTVPFQLAERSGLIPSSLTAALFPRFSAVPLSDERILAHEAMKVLVVIMTPIIVTCVLFIKPFLTWWVGAEFGEESGFVGQVILLGFWVNGFAKIPYAQLLARGKPGLVAKCHLFELIPYFLLLYFGLYYFGLLGAAFAFTFRVFIDFVLLSALAGGLSLLFGVVFIPAILLVGALFVSSQLSSDNQFFVTSIFGYLSITTGWAWWRAPNSIRNQVIATMKPFFKGHK